MPPITTFLAAKIQKNRKKIDEFFLDKFTTNPAIFYNSIDLRNSGVKIAPVDTNCFPAGFNNLTSIGKNLAKKLVAEFFNQNQLQPKKILLIAENHTRNMRYFENLAVLAEILSEFGEVRICNLSFEIISKTEIPLENGAKITLYPLVKTHGFLACEADFLADFAILNNDLTDGLPEIFQNTKTKILPSPNLGWFQRSKQNHFSIYNQLAVELAEILEIDPWLISTFSQKIDDLNFKQQLGIEGLAVAVDEILLKIAGKYHEYGINEQPYCFVKADNGTYGMAVWAVSSGDEIRNINKKERSKMNVVKGAVENHSVIIQEGVPTIDKIQGQPCEPMIYLINGQVVENLFRFNGERDEKISLNAGGAKFASIHNLPEPDGFEAEEDCISSELSGKNSPANQFSSDHFSKNIAVYELIARLACLAAANEINNSNLKIPKI